MTLDDTAAAGAFVPGLQRNTTAGAATTTTIASGGLLNINSAGTVAICNDVVVSGGTVQSTASSGTAGIGFVAGQAGTLTINSGLVNFGNLTVNFGRSHQGVLNLSGGTYMMNAAPTVGTSGGVLNFNGGTLQLNNTSRRSPRPVSVDTSETAGRTSI